MRLIGVSGGFGHDAAAALVVDGLPVFALEEERVSRVKEAPWAPPIGAVREALVVGECTLADIDAIAVSWDPRLVSDDRRPADHVDDLAGALRASFGTCPPLVFVGHHLAHAAAAHLTGPFDDAAVLVLDDRGEDRSGTVFAARGTRLDERLVLPIRASLGAMYSAATTHVGFEPTEAGKTMGLAAHGRATHELGWLRATPDGCTFASDFVSGFGPDDRFPDWRAVFAHVFGDPCPPGTPRRHGIDAFAERQLDAAASAQAALERMLMHLARLACDHAGSRRLVLTGGVALNCTANGRLRGSGLVDDLHVLGAAGDAGGALGAALWVAVEHGAPRPAPLRSLGLGAPVEAGEVIDRARSLGLEVTVGSADDVAGRVAGLIAGGAIGGWVQGRDEFGPRALGHRSIVARADDRSVAHRVNLVKRRESWRPLAPALDTEAGTEIGLDDLRGLHSMVEARWPVRPGPIAGTTHVDGSTRPLHVDTDDHPFAALLAALRARTGSGILLNTSFNRAGEPLVHDAVGAFATFCTSDLDFVGVEDVLITKPAWAGAR